MLLSDIISRFTICSEWEKKMFPVFNLISVTSIRQGQTKDSSIVCPQSDYFVYRLCLLFLSLPSSCLTATRHDSRFVLPSTCLFVRPVCLSVTYVFPSSWLPSLFFCCLSLNAWCKINHPRSLAFPGIGVISRTDPVIPVRYENHIICVFWFLQLISVFVCSVIIDKNIIDNNR